MKEEEEETDHLMDLTTTDEEMNVQALVLVHAQALVHAQVLAQVLVHAQVLVLANHVAEEDNVHVTLLEDGIDVQVLVLVLVNHVEEEEDVHLISLILTEDLEEIADHQVIVVDHFRSLQI